MAGERVVARLRVDLYTAVIQQEIGFFDLRRTGELTNRLASDTTVLQNAVTVNLSMALRFGLQALGSIAILLWTSWKLTLVMLAVVPLVAAGAGFTDANSESSANKFKMPWPFHRGGEETSRVSALSEHLLANRTRCSWFCRPESFRLAVYRAKLGAIFTG